MPPEGSKLIRTVTSLAAVSPPSNIWLQNSYQKQSIILLKMKEKVVEKRGINEQTLANKVNKTKVQDVNH